MVGWHHRLNGHEFEQAPGVGDGQGGLACCSWVTKSQTGLRDSSELICLYITKDLSFMLGALIIQQEDKYNLKSDKRFEGHFINETIKMATNTLKCSDSLFNNKNSLKEPWKC